MAFVEKLMEDFLKQDKKRTPDLFLYTLIFLYGVGIIINEGYKIGLNIEINEDPF
ncbi:MAG: hypothetical protein WDO71_17805 [Bacteroidota bacterium]